MSKINTFPIPPEEEKRIQSILDYQILDTNSEEQLDELTKLAASMFNVPIVLITIIDQKRQWFKSNHGLSLKETERSISFCQYTILGNDVLEISDTLQDERFSNNPLVKGEPFMRYYCGAPLTNENGYKMGSLALIDRMPRKLDIHQKKTLKLLADQVINFFELKMKRKELEKEKQQLEEKVAQRTRELEQKVKELKQRDEKLFAVNNELNRLIYKASHDLLGPLRTLQGLTSLAINEKNIDSIYHYLKLLYSTEQKLDNSLVNLLKVVTIKDASSPAVIDWHVIIEKALSKAMNRVEGKQVKIKLDNSVIKQYIADPILLEMILEELFINSLQYNLNQKASIFININQEEKGIALQISDNGIGINEESKDRIFEMFYKHSVSKGSGLGLYIVEKAVEQLKGRIDVQSMRNQGTTFHLLLPFQHDSSDNVG